MGPKKRKTITLSIKQKFDILQQLQKGKKQTEVVTELEVSRSVVSRIWNNKDDIQKEAEKVQLKDRKPHFRRKLSIKIIIS